MGNAIGSVILAVNGGSSSLKFGLFDAQGPHRRSLSGRIERAGTPEAKLIVKDADGKGLEDRSVQADDSTSVVGVLMDWIDRSAEAAKVAAVGHRVVHGGGRYRDPARITPEMIEELRGITHFDPEHLPEAIALIEAFQTRDANLAQVACFDTAFHHDMPRVAQIVPIPRRFEAAGVRRYGFHGLSYEYLMVELARVGAPGEAQGRVVLAHLGSGASLAAVKGGHPIDTSMGFTPASGLVMGTRSGDLDPGLVRFLAGAEGIDEEGFDRLANRESGLLGISETSGDIRDLLARQATDVRAAEAIEVFCYRVRAFIGAFAASLGGLDTLVFSGGIGENAAEVRRRICENLGFLGIVLDQERNEGHAPVISSDGGRASVRVIRTDEELMIARATAHLVAGSA